MKAPGIALAVVIAQLAFGSAAAAYTVTEVGMGGVDASALASSLLSGASGITITSATYTGANRASGIFSGGGSIFGINQGVVLTSGSASSFGTNSNNVAGYVPLQ